MKGIEKHITLGEMVEKDKIYRLLPGRKRLVDMVRMITYRAETAMVSLLKSATVDSSTGRQLLQNLFVTEADIFPDKE